VPVFCSRQVLTKLFPGLNFVPPGMVMSLINAAWSQTTPVASGVWDGKFESGYTILMRLRESLQIVLKRWIRWAKTKEDLNPKNDYNENSVSISMHPRIIATVLSTTLTLKRRQMTKSTTGKQQNRESDTRSAWEAHRKYKVFIKRRSS
jgi:hypothetical protein